MLDRSKGSPPLIPPRGEERWMAGLLVGLCLMVSGCCLVGCKGDDTSNLPPEQQALVSAVAKLSLSDWQGYMELTVESSELDSTQLAWRQLAVQQNTERMVRRHGKLTRISVYDTVAGADSTLTLYYYQHFASDDSIACSQTMVKKKGRWMLKL